MTYARKFLPELDYKESADAWLDDSTVRKSNTKGHCSEPQVCPAYLHLMKIPEECTEEVYDVGNKRDEANIIRNGMIAGGVGFDEGDKSTHSVVNPSQEHIFPNEHSLESQLVPFHCRKPWTDALYIPSLHRAQQLGM